MIGQAVIQLRERDDRAPYKALNAAAVEVAKRYPDASVVRPQWAPASSQGEILVAVTQNGRTRVVAP